MSSLEQHYCPDHHYAIPGMPAYDEWLVDRWSDGRESTRFPAGFAHPRTCSYCGGLHPEDTISLVEQGWELELSTKRYKAYLHPPGYHASLSGLFSITTDGLKQPPKCEPSPVPPEKMYISHFTDEQRERLAAALERQQKS